MAEDDTASDNDKDVKPQDPHDPADYGSTAASAGSEDISIDAALSADARKKEEDTDAPLPIYKEKKVIVGGVIGVILLIVMMMVYSCQPQKGSMAYGICSTLLEMQTQYPNTIRHINLEGSKTAVRIYFTSIDAFGEFKLEMFECKFGPDEKMGMRITDIIRNRQSVGPVIIEQANKVLPVIMSSDPYRVRPPEWKNQLLLD